MRYLLLCLFIIANFITNAQINQDSEAEILYETSLQYSGDVVQIGLPMFALIMAHKKKDKQGMKQMTYGFTTNIVLTHILKKAIRKKRPENSTAYNAFPSGHTSTAFQAAVYIYKRYGWKYGIPSIALASLVGYSRIEGIDDRHDLTDVVGGALLGSTIALLFTSEYNQGGSVSVLPSNSGLAIGYTLTF